MRRYETIFIAPDSVTDESVREISEKIQAIITRMGGKIARTDYWGRRTMAYEIAKSRRGQYVLIVYVAGSDVVAEVERNLHIIEQVVRFHTVKVEDDVDINAVVPEESKPAPAELFGERAPRREFSNEAESEDMSDESVA